MRSDSTSVPAALTCRRLGSQHPPSSRHLQSHEAGSFIASRRCGLEPPGQRRRRVTPRLDASNKMRDGQRRESQLHGS